MPHCPQPISLDKKFAEFGEFWSPKIVAQMNDYHLKIAKVKGDFIWHRHEETDEVFYVVSGELNIDFRVGVVALRAGEMIVVPKGIEHRPRASEECRILLIEPAGTVNTGDAAETHLDAGEGEWI